VGKLVKKRWRVMCMAKKLTQSLAHEFSDYLFALHHAATANITLEHDDGPSLRVAVQLPELIHQHHAVVLTCTRRFGDVISFC